jgi:hypothetical protein
LDANPTGTDPVRDRRAARSRTTVSRGHYRGILPVTRRTDMLVDPPDDPALTTSAAPGVTDRPAAPEPGDDGFLSARPPRHRTESAVVRVVATGGIVGIGTAVGAVLGALDVAVWIVALVVSLLCVLLAALLWRSRML